MCGFAGFINSNHNVESQLIKMANAIEHRGPDDQGVWFDIDNKIGMAHRRLSIVDLSPAGHQPMVSPCKRYVISFNGEIYNHLKLRDQLQSDGLLINWRGHSDTETLLACFSHWGIMKTLQSTTGMFALALWDRKELTLTLARDRMGEKPLYWGWQDDTLLFGSELKALKEHSSFKNEVDRSSLMLLLRYNYIPSPFSIYKGISKLDAGHYIQFSSVNNSYKCTDPIPYWQVNDSIEFGRLNPFKGSDDEAIENLENILTQSVSQQMLADVPLGAFLSGGVDSSTIVALMQAQSSKPVRTFTIGFEEKGFNEAEHALNIANFLKTDHTELYVTPNDALNIIPSLPIHFCEPFADSSQIPTLLVSKLAREHVTVALSGDGGDELFGGYNPYQFAPKIWNKLDMLPLCVRQYLPVLFDILPTKGKLEKLKQVLPAKDHYQFYSLLQSHWSSPEQLVTNGIEPITKLTNPKLWPETDNFPQWMMAMDSQVYMPDDILVKVDRSSMASSLETRVPMLDHNVFEFASSLPIDMKIRDGQGKWILRQLLYRYVPKSLIERPKKGFSMPIAIWLRTSLRDWAENLLSEANLLKCGYLNTKLIRNIWSEHLNGIDHSTRLWSILMFLSWLDVNE